MNRHSWTDDKIFFRLLNNKSEKTYWDNVRELRSRANETVFERSYDLANSNIIKEKIIGIDLLSQLGLPPRPFYKQTIKLYFELLATQTSIKVSLALLHGIAQNNQHLTTPQVSAIASLKDSKNAGIRKGVVDALLGIDNKIAINTLILLSTDRVVSVRDWATFGIGTQVDKNNKSITEALWNRIQDKNQNIRFEAIMGLAKRHDPRISNVINRELKENNFGTLLFEAIEELKDKEFIPVLKQNLKSVQNDTSVNSIWIDKLEACIKELESY